MSIESMALVLHHSRAAGTTKLVLLGIANHDGDGGAWPSIATLARYANASERSVQRAISELVRLGEITVAYQEGGGAKADDRYRPNRYDVALECPPGCDRSKHHRMPGVTSVENGGSGVTSTTVRGDASVTPDMGPGVTPVSPEPSLEPPINQSPPTPLRGEPVDNPRKCTQHVRPKAYCQPCHQPPDPPPPAWCGTCDPQGQTDLGARMVAVIDDEGTERWGICPSCHPAAFRRTA